VELGDSDWRQLLAAFYERTEIATLRRLREERKSSPRGTSSPLELAIE
jgi:hypothetical protein